MALKTRANGEQLRLSNYATQTLTNSAAETTIFSGTVPAGVLGTDRSLQVDYYGSVVTGLLPPNMTIRLKFGGVTTTMINNIPMLASQSNRPISITVKIFNRDSSNSQFILCSVRNPGSLSILTGLSVMEEVSATSSVDTTVNQTLEISAQFGSAVATTTLTTQVVEAMIE